jgi:hypothetical protein
MFIEIGKMVKYSDEENPAQDFNDLYLPGTLFFCSCSVLPF